MAPTGGGGSSAAIWPLVLTLTGATCLAVVAIVAVILKRRRSSGKSKEFILPTETRPVIGFKHAAGPGGLKKSPSPLQSPENPERKTESIMDVSTVSSDSSFVEMDACDLETAAATGSTMHQGTLSFNVKYNFDKNALAVNIIAAQELPQIRGVLLADVDGSGSMDPYVKLQLLPEKQHKVKTRVVRNTANPVYDEEFTFYGITYNQLHSTTLHFAVICFDRYSRDEIIGEVLCPLHGVDLSDSDKEVALNLPLISRNLKFQSTTERGEVLLSLSYQPNTNKLNVGVLKARNLPKFEVTGMADPYVKVYLLYNGQRIDKKKSHVKKRTLNPVYNEAFDFELPSSDMASLSNVSLEVFVMDWDRLTKNEVMGRVQIGSASKTDSGRQHWADMVQTPRRQLAEWHKLRP